MKLVCSLGVALLAATVTAQADVVKQPVQYTVDGKPYEGMLVYDDTVTDPRPGVLVVPSWLGVTDAAADKAAIIAGQEYVVLLADVYGADVRPDGNEEAAKASGALREDRAELRKRASAALDVLRGELDGVAVDGDRLAAAGFCFGGTTALELARSGAALAGAISFHGHLDTPTPAAPGDIQAAILVLHGDADPAIPPPDVHTFQEEMRTAEVDDWQLVSYGNAVHSFTNPEAGERYDPAVARRAYAAAHDFLAEVLAEPPSR